MHFNYTMSLQIQLSESFEDIIQKVFKKIGSHSDDVGPRPFSGYHEMRHNSAVTRQNQLEFWNKKAKKIFS